MLKRLNNQSGIAIVATVIMLVLMAYFLVTLFDLTSTGFDISYRNYQKSRTETINNAASQRSLNQLDNGWSPDASNFSFANGSFTVTSDPVNETVTVTTTSDEAETEYTFETEFTKSCIDILHSNSKYVGQSLYDIYLDKSCHSKGHITDVAVSWDWTGHCDPSDSNQVTCDAEINKVIFDSPQITIFNGSGDSGDTLDVTDSTMELDSAHPFGIDFSENIPSSGTYDITVTYADNSTDTVSFSINGAGGGTPSPGSKSGDGFTVDVDQDIEVVPLKTVTVDILGSAITCGKDGPSIDVRVDLGLDGVYSTLFNDDPVTGGEQDISSTVGSTVDYSIQARATLASCNSFSRTIDSKDLDHARVLVNGDAVPNYGGANGQESLESFLDSYVDGSGNLQLNSNQAIILMELGTDLITHPNSLAADFQDLVVLVTVDDS